MRLFFLKKKNLLIPLVSVFQFFIFFIIQRSAVNGATSTGTILPPCVQDGNCGLCDFLIGFSNIANYLLSFLGSAALLLFIYGGFIWLTAGGNMDYVKKGRDILLNTVYGILIVFCAWEIVNFIIASMTGTPFNAVKIFGNPWYTYCS